MSFSASEIKEIRADFPHTKLGHVYLNHAAISPISNTVKNAIDSYLQERHSGSIENMEQTSKLVEEYRKLISDFIHAPTPDSITFMANTSEALSAIAEGLDWQPGDQIILNTMEFPANVQPFRILENKGVEIIYAKPVAGKITTDVLDNYITDRTKIISISAVQYLNGFKADLKSTGELCRRHDIFFIVDGIQALGVVPIDVQAAQIDALATGGQKWLMSLAGQGFLYLSEKLSRKLSPARTGWFSVKEPFEMSNFEQEWRPVSQHLEAGTPNFLGIIALGASVKRFIKLGPEKTHRRVLDLTSHLIKKLEKQQGVEMLTPVNESQRAGVVSFKHNKIADTQEVVKSLKKKGISISTREGFLRISPHFYNTEEEIDLALEAIF